MATEEAQWETVDLASLSFGDCRTVGGEAAVWQAWKDLGLSNILQEIGVAAVQIQQAALLVSGGLLHPGSERETATWAKEMSALDEILGADFKNSFNNALYRLADLLVVHRAEIEVGLARAARELFPLGEKIIHYDLTNTNMAGRVQESSLGQRGHSKEKRHDRPLLTLVLVLDGDGFPKASQVFPGNVSEPGTLMEMLQTFREEMAAAPPPDQRPGTLPPGNLPGPGSPPPNH